MNVKRWVLEIKGSTRDNVAAKLSLFSVSAVQVRVYKFDGTSWEESTFSGLLKH